jgi:hypothetical protein
MLSSGSFRALCDVLPEIVPQFVARVWIIFGPLAFWIGSSGQPLLAQNPLTLLTTIDVDKNGVAGAVDGLAISADGSRLAASDNSATAFLFDLSNLPIVRQVGQPLVHAEVAFDGGQTPLGEVNAVAFSPDGRWLVTGSDQVGAKLWNLQTGEVIANLDVGTNCDGAAFSPDGKYLASAANFRLVVRQFDMASGKVGAPVLDHAHGDAGEVNSIAWTTDSRRVASGALKTIKVFQAGEPNFSLLLQIPNESRSGSVKSVRISPDNRLLAIGARDERARVFDLDTGEIVVDLRHEGNRKPLPGDDQDKNIAVEAVAWSEDGNYLFTSGLVDGVLRAWRRDDWSLVGWAQAQEPQRALEMLAVHGDCVAAGGDEGVVRIYRFEPSPLRSRLVFPPGPRRDLAVEAEDFDTNLPQGKHHWRLRRGTAAGRDRYLQALPADGTQFDSDFQTYDPTRDSPKLDYCVADLTAATYQIWVRGRSKTEENATLYLGLGGDEATAASFQFEPNVGWQWKMRELVVPEAGEATFHVWMGTAGVEFDRWVLALQTANDPILPPTGLGPNAVPRRLLNPAGAE